MTRDANLDKPIFILGTARSGTTLLRYMLDSHKRIAIGGETNIFRALSLFCCDRSDAARDFPLDNPFCIGQNNVGWYERYDISREQLVERIRLFVSDLFSPYLKARGKARLGEKSPSDTHFCELILEIFPLAQFIHIVRDPRAVCSSLLSWSVPIENSAKMWLRENLRVVTFGETLPKDQYLRIRYEDLIVEPEENARKILSFLKEDWDPNVLKHHVRMQETITRFHRKHTPSDAKAYDDYFEGSLTNNPERAIDLESLVKWKKKMRKLHVRKVQSLTEVGMEMFGYSKISSYRLIPILGVLK